MPIRDCVFCPKDKPCQVCGGHFTLETGGDQEIIFTFGSNHFHPFTGESMGRRFLPILARDRAAAICEMQARFGRKYSFDYESRERAGVDTYHLVNLLEGNQDIMAILRARLAVAQVQDPEGPVEREYRRLIRFLGG